MNVLPTNGDLWAARDAIMSASDWLKHANRTGTGKAAAMGQYNKARAQFDRVAKAIREGRPVYHVRRYVPDFDSNVGGIPCGVVIERITGGYPGSMYEPPEPPEAEVMLVDRNGYPALWLEGKACVRDWERLECEAIQHAKEIADDAEVDRKVMELEMRRMYG